LTTRCSSPVADRRHRDGYYSGKLNQLNDLWRQFCDLDEEVQQAALPTGSEYSLRLEALKELVEKYQNIFLDNMPTGASEGTQTNFGQHQAHNKRSSQRRFRN